MLYTILISLVLISEIILFITIISLLLKIDKKIIKFNKFLVLQKTNIQKICELCKNISWQVKELSTDFVEKYTQAKYELGVDVFSKILFGLLLWKINKKCVLKFKHSKFVKLLGQGLKLLEIVV